ncbi:MAG: hypothetical protein U9Q03_05835 [Patescibacteria group bacterium]|nr:hypothetical protein [Patescibacteria group bacterium]
MQKDQIQFLDLVERVPLTPEEKTELKRLAGAGVDKASWRKLDDMIVASLKSRRLTLRGYREALDAETRRIMTKHEDGVRAVDIKLKEDLERADEDDAERDRLWAEYYKEVYGMQEQLLDEMKQTSAILKQKAFSRVLRGGAA